MNKKYYVSLDNWKGAAMLWIVLGHIGFLFINARFFHSDSLLISVYKFCDLITPVVDAFLITTGFLFAKKVLDNSLLNYGAFLKSRALRILPIYLTVLLSVYLVERDFFLLEKTTLRDFVPYIFLFQNYRGHINMLNHTWYIALITQFYILFGALFWAFSKAVRDKENRRVTLLICLSFLIAAITAIKWKYAQSYDSRMLQYRCDAILFGCILFLVEESLTAGGTKLPHLLRNISFAVGASSFGVIAMTAPHAYGKHPFLMTANYLSIGLMIMGTNDEKDRAILIPRSRNVLGYIGKYSLGIYLCHVPIIVILFNKYKIVGQNFVVLLFLSILSGITIEKIYSYLCLSRKKPSAQAA